MGEPTPPELPAQWAPETVGHVWTITRDGARWRWEGDDGWVMEAPPGTEVETMAEYARQERVIPLAEAALEAARAAAGRHVPGDERGEVRAAAVARLRAETADDPTLLDDVRRLLDPHRHRPDMRAAIALVDHAAG